MTLVWLCALWVFASVVVAMLPMRRQFFPGVILLLAAPLLIVMIWMQSGPVAGLAAVAAFVSMFRNPLRYLMAKMRGERPEISQ